MPFRCDQQFHGSLQHRFCRQTSFAEESYSQLPRRRNDTSYESLRRAAAGGHKTHSFSEGCFTRRGRAAWATPSPSRSLKLPVKVGDSRTDACIVKSHADRQGVSVRLYISGVILRVRLCFWWDLWKSKGVVLGRILMDEARQPEMVFSPSWTVIWTMKKVLKC